MKNFLCKSFLFVVLLGTYASECGWAIGPSDQDAVVALAQKFENHVDYVQGAISKDDDIDMILSACRYATEHSIQLNTTLSCVARSFADLKDELGKPNALIVLKCLIENFSKTQRKYVSGEVFEEYDVLDMVDIIVKALS